MGRFDPWAALCAGSVSSLRLVKRFQARFPGLGLDGSRRLRPLVAFGTTISFATMSDHIEVEGKITSVLPGTMFRVQLDNEHEVLAVISGKMRKRWIRLSTGDRVKMEMSPYDVNKARIVWRLR